MRRMFSTSCLPPISARYSIEIGITTSSANARPLVVRMLIDGAQSTIANSYPLRHLSRFESHFSRSRLVTRSSSASASRQSLAITSRFSRTSIRASAAVSRPWAISAMLHSSGSRPNHAPTLPCGSRSARRTDRPAVASPAARCTAVVVLPVPPLWLTTAILRMGEFRFLDGSRVRRYADPRLSSTAFGAEPVEVGSEPARDRKREELGHLIGMELDDPIGERVQPIRPRLDDEEPLRRLLHSPPPPVDRADVRGRAHAGGQPLLDQGSRDRPGGFLVRAGDEDHDDVPGLVQRRHPSPPSRPAPSVSGGGQRPSAARCSRARRRPTIDLASTILPASIQPSASVSGIRAVSRCSSGSVAPLPSDRSSARNTRSSSSQKPGEG